MVFEWLQSDNEEFKDTETLFQKAYDEGDNDTMFKCVHRVCLALTKKKLKGIKIPEDDLMDVALDATITAVNRMRKNKCRPDKLTSYLFWIVFGELYHPKRVFNDSLYSLEELQEKYGDSYLEETLGEEESNEENEESL